MGKTKEQSKKGSKKKQRVDESSSSVPPPPLGTLLRCEDPHDSSRFNYYMSQNYFYSHTDRGIIAERQFNIVSFGLVDKFGFRKWQKFCDEPIGEGNSLMVKEFYSNMNKLPMDREHSFVRGKTIKFRSEDVNKFYGLPRVKREECEYFQAVNGDWRVYFADVARTLEGNRLQWTYNPDGSPKFVIETQFNLVAKGVNKLVCYRILPTAQHVKVPWKHALLIHLIINGGQISLGHIISDNMQAVGENKRNGFPYPSLIAGLVKAAGVQWNFGGDKVKIIRPISRASLESNKREVRGMNARVIEEHIEEEAEYVEEEDDDDDDDDYMVEAENEVVGSGAASMGGSDVDRLSARMDMQFAITMDRQDQLHDYMVRMAPQYDDGRWQRWPFPESSSSQHGPWDYQFRPPQ